VTKALCCVLPESCFWVQALALSKSGYCGVLSWSVLLTVLHAALDMYPPNALHITMHTCVHARGLLWEQRPVLCFGCCAPLECVCASVCLSVRVSMYVCWEWRFVQSLYEPVCIFVYASAGSLR
jgi:hypothetical protein